MPYTFPFIDAKAVACDEDGRSSFDWLRHRHHDGSVFLYAFDLIALEGDDLPRPSMTCYANRDADVRPGERSQCRAARPDLGERWPSRLVATAEEDRLRFRRKPHNIVCGSSRLPSNRDLCTSRTRVAARP
jgi:hypothetical protein